MSNILRRPMFRMGGKVNSQGTGIMSGVEPRMNYQIGGPVYMPTAGSFEEAYKTKQKQERLLGRIPTYESAEQDYEKQVADLQRNIDMFSSPEDFFMSEQASQKLNFLESPEGKKQFIGEKLAERDKKIAEAKASGVIEDLLPKTAKQIVEPKEQKPTQPKTKIKTEDGVTKEIQESDLKALYKDLLPLFEKELGPEEDEFRRQKYMQLAKFGLGLLAQPGGSLVEAVGRAGEKPLAGLESVAAREAQARRAPRALALEAALKQVDPSELMKKVRDIKKINPNLSDQQALDLLTLSKQTGQTKESRIKTNAAALSEEIGTGPGLKAARNMETAGLDLGLFSKLPKDKKGNILQDKVTEGYYYDEKGNLFKVDQEGIQQIQIK